MSNPIEDIRAIMDVKSILNNGKKMVSRNVLYHKTGKKGKANKCRL